MCRDDRRAAHDGLEGVSPEGWLPDRVELDPQGWVTGRRISGLETNAIVG